MNLTKDRARGSKFIGVLKNGSCWQVSSRSSSQQRYLCSVDDEEVAAVLNDVISIQTRGKEGKTNFDWSGSKCAALL